MNFFKKSKPIPKKDYLRRSTINVLNFDRVYTIKTRRSINVNKVKHIHTIYRYFKLYEEKLKKQISVDLDVDKSRVFINSMRPIDDIMSVSYEIFIETHWDKSLVVNKVKLINFTDIKFINDFMKSHLGRIIMKVDGETKNISCFSFEI